jgi:hypothetical protein
VHHEPHASWEQVRLKHLEEEIQPFEKEKDLSGLPRPLVSADRERYAEKARIPKAVNGSR